MKLLWLYFFGILIGPLIGVIDLYLTSYVIFAGEVDSLLVFTYIFNLSIMILITLVLSNYGINKFYINHEENKRKLDPKSVFNKSILLLILCALFIFTIGGHKILFGLSDKGEIRAAIGILGFTYKWVYLYLTPSIIVLASLIFVYKKRPHYLKKKLYLLYFIGFAIGFMTGYKFTIITILIPGLVILLINRSTGRLLLILILCLIFLLAATFFHQSYDSPLFYLYHRATALAAAGTIGMWNQFPQGVGFEGFIFNLLSIFGNKITSLVTNIDPNSTEYLKYNMSQYITYLVYPDKEGALKGSVNLTVTNLGEGIYLLGRKFSIIFSVITGIICGLTIRSIKKSINKGYVLKATIFIVYFFSIIMPWLNSGGIFVLISIPVIFGFFALYFILKILLTKIKYVKEE